MKIKVLALALLSHHSQSVQEMLDNFQAWLGIHQANYHDLNHTRIEFDPSCAVIIGAETKRPDSIRLVLDGPGQMPIYWPVDKEGDVGDDPLDPETAIQFIREGMDFVVAVACNKDEHSHYQSDVVNLYRV